MKMKILKLKKAKLKNETYYFENNILKLFFNQ